MYNWLNEYEDGFDEMGEWVKEFNSNYDNSSYLKIYEFTDAADNPYMDHPAPFQEGVKLFKEGKIDQVLFIQ
jgi:hypothetical protein